MDGNIQNGLAGLSQSMDNPNGHPNTLRSLKAEMEQYRMFDDARNHRIEALIIEVEKLTSQLNNAQADIIDAMNSRRQYQRDAQEAKDIITKLASNRYAVLLVDGDGYKFNDRYFQGPEGGAAAARELVTSVQNHLGANINVLVNVYANRQGLAKALYEAEIIHTRDYLDSFFCACNQSQPLFHFIDCGYGKERADAKLRGKSFGPLFYLFTSNTFCYLFTSNTHI
jgi:hypothetical protein